jgi:hypothetical protein
LLDSPPHQIQVWPETETTDADDNPVFAPGPTPVTVPCHVQPVSGEEDTDIVGQAVVTRYRVIARSFPAGPFAYAQWAGTSWDIDGEPMRSGSSEATSHVTVMLRAREPEGV